MGFPVLSGGVVDLGMVCVCVWVGVFACMCPPPRACTHHFNIHAHIVLA